MKTRTTLAAASLVVLGGLGTAAGVASAQGDPARRLVDTARTPKGEFVCANLAQIQQVQADHATLITDRLTLLASARSAAEEAGRTKAVERIDRRTAKLTERQQKVADAPAEAHRLRRRQLHDGRLIAGGWPAGQPRTAGRISSTILRCDRSASSRSTPRPAPMRKKRRRPISCSSASRSMQ